MRKALLLIVAVLISASIFAQTRATFISEHFNAQSMPTGWQVIGNASNWSISATQNAGGEANEAKLDWSPQFNGMTRLATPAVDLTGVSSVVFSFKHALDNYQGSNAIGIATSADGGTTWNSAWTQSYNTSGAWSVMETITSPDMGSSSVMFCIYFDGSSYNINDWYFDDIEIFTMENLDAQLASIDMNSVMGAGSKDIKCTVTNKGVETINEITLSYEINGSTVVETFPVNLASLQSTQLTFADQVFLTPETYFLTINVDAVNGTPDDDPSNDLLEKTINIALGETQRIPMIEHFSSSTCGPCVNVNVTMSTLTANNPGKYTYTKYQMNWPGNGDPYYTAEGGVRRTYYGVQAVPQCFLDGQDQGYAAVTQNALDNHYNDPAFADVRGSFNVSGNVITVKVDYMSYYELNTAKAFVSVNEKETHGNVGTNGETSFHHVFMKFLTSTTGNPVDIPAGGNTNVEDMSDLEVSAWLQEYGTKEMLNSHFMYEYTDIHLYPVQNLVASAQEGVITATWEAPEDGNAQAYNVYVNGALAQTVTDLEFSAPTTEDFNVVEVQAVYANDMTSVKIVQAALAPETNLTLNTTNIVFNEQGETAALIITNNTADAVTIDEIAENPETEYLVLEFGTVALPYTLEVGESMEVIVSPNYYGRGLVTTFVNVVSSLGTQTVDVTVDSSWYDGVVESNDNCTIYPNPTTGNFTVESTNVALVEVYNLVGQKVFEAQGQVVNVNASSWDKGVYLVNVKYQNGSVKTQKLMVK